MNYTTEQENIIYSDADNIFVIALAGTGKTTTLIGFSKVRKKESFLYLVYNSALKEDVQPKFGNNVRIETIHSLAYKELGFNFKGNLKNQLKLEDLHNFLMPEVALDICSESLYRVQELMKRFLYSKAKSLEEIPFDEETLNLAMKYWELMKNKTAPMTHDGYLKLFYLSEPKLDYDWIMVDEAQDASEVMLEIIFPQKASMILVGDNNQKIYGWRGAINAFEYDHNKNIDIHTLTHSFRFGPVIANAANQILDFKKAGVKLIGCDRYSTIEDLEHPYTLITRTSRTIFDEALKAVQAGKKIHIYGTDFFDLIYDIMNLYLGKKDLINSEFIRKFDNFKKFASMVDVLGMIEFKGIVKLVSDYDQSLENSLSLIKKSLVSARLADISFVTAHKSKGSEYLFVKLANDFTLLHSQTGGRIPLESIDEEELNLIYVAMTRAIEKLQLNSDLKKFLNYI